MNSVIMGWSNSQFYKNLLIADSSVASETLQVSSPAVINGVELKLVIESPFVFCDSVGVDGMTEDCESSEISKSNFGEVHLVKQYADLLVEQKIANNIAIITPYAKQVELLRQACPSVGEVSTVDSFQGREADVVIISLVRSNMKRQVGFLADSRRLNVAITRARRQVFIIGDSETICADPVLKSLFDYACNSALLISAQTLVSEHAPPETTGRFAAPIKKKEHPRKTAERPKLLKPAIQFGETDDTRKNLRSQILLAPEGEKHFFPNTLSSSERRHIHSLCEQMGLSHGSTGEGSQRQVWIHKKVVEEKVSERAFSEQELSDEEELSEDHVHEEKPSQEKPEGTKPLVKTKGRIIPSPAEPPTPGICPHVNCKMSVRLVSVSCLHCKREFCVAHAFPELHGCGDAAKKAARKPVVPQQGKGGIASEALRKKINSKLDSLQAKRSTTSVPKKK
jgi:ATP-dependent RNA/DNA helicase IGHMBP2